MLDIFVLELEVVMVAKEVQAAFLKAFAMLLAAVAVEVLGDIVVVFQVPLEKVV